MISNLSEGSIFLPIQIFLIFFLVFAISRVFLRFKDGGISFAGLLFWLALWLLAITSIIKPDFTTFLAKKIGIGRGADVVLYISIVTLFYLIFRTNVMLENIRQEITKLTREIALREDKKK